jgi:DNA-binding transcriptional MocR family regulator
MREEGMEVAANELTITTGG